MKKMIKIVWIILGIMVLAIVCFIIAVAVTGKATIQPFYNENGEVLEGSIAERTFVEINGRKNGMIIRGKNVDNPVLLFISGGPGVPQYWMNETYENQIEDHFTVCWWDYYGEGMSYDASLNPSDITLEQLEADAVEVSEYLKERFGKDRIYLMAHSAGTKLGLKLAEEQPDNFYCYFAMAQAIDNRHLAGYPYLKEHFEQTNNKKGLRLLDKHIKIVDGKPVIYNTNKLESDWESALLMAGCATTREMRSDALEIFFPQIFSKCYTLNEKINFWRGKLLCQNSAYSETRITTDQEPAVQIPVYFISGRYDYTCPINLVEELYQNIEAPDKALYIFEDSAHSPLFEENKATLEVLLQHVE